VRVIHAFLIIMGVTFKDEQEEVDKSLGRVQLRSETGEVILIPKPSSDPNDPLNW